MKRCHACGKEFAVGREVGRKDVCPGCNADIRCCLNCSFYDPVVSKQCREPGVELVREKARANFCDFFSCADRDLAGGSKDGQAAARKALDDLFRK